MLETKKVKSYFKTEGTVAKWWNPTKEDYAYLFENQLEIICNWLKNETINSCLEVSCGKGRVTPKLSLFTKHYLATDISKEMIKIAKLNFPKVHYEIQDAENLKIQSNSKDCVICLEALVHYPNPKKAINEFYRVLKKNGILIIDSDNTFSFRRLIKKSYNYIERIKHPFGEDIFTSYSKKEFIKMITCNSFKIEKFKYIGTISPITIHTKSKKKVTLLEPHICKKLHKLNIDRIDYLNRLATYHLILARK